MVAFSRFAFRFAQRAELAFEARLLRSLASLILPGISERLGLTVHNFVRHNSASTKINLAYAYILCLHLSIKMLA